MTREAKMELGPVDYMIVAFPGSEFRGEITPAIGKLVDSGTIRIIDAAFVSKSESGDILGAELAAEEPAYMAELTQLAQLRDQGILTPEEFEAKKKQVLGL